MTSLHIAIMKGQNDIAKFLIAKGADIHIKGIAGLTPLSIAIQKDNKKIVDLLRTHGAVE